MLIDAGLTVKIEMTDMANWLKRMQSGPEFDPASGLQPLVLRLPGCRRRAVPVAAFLQRLGQCAGSRDRDAF